MNERLREAILWYALESQGEWQQIALRIKNKAPVQRVRYPGSFVTIVDPEYPSCFRQLRYPPWILFYEGDFSYLQKRGIAIIGSRNCTSSALNNTKIITDRLKKRYVIVSGLAKGIDSMAHRCSLDQKTIGFIGCGLDTIYPKENAFLYQEMSRRHLILSEYPMHTKPLAHHFPWRNRLIAASCDALIVIQAKCKSGTMHTVNECLELSKPVYCVPSAFEDKEHTGCNWLIQNGAYIIVEESDLDEL